MQLPETDGRFVAAGAKLMNKTEHPNDANICNSFCSKPDGRNASRFGFSGFDLVLPAMVQHLSVQKDRGRPAARLHEPVHGGLSLGRA